MLMLAPPTSTGANVVLCGGVTNSFGSKLAGAISHGSSAADLRQCSPVLEWEGLKDAFDGADTVYLLSALDLPPLPTDSDLEAFTSGASRVVDCCLECGVRSLVFASSSSVVSSRMQGRGQNQERPDGASIHEAEDKVVYVTHQEDARAHAVARAEASVLEASGGVRSSTLLHTCALRPAPVVYGDGTPEQDSLLCRTLSWLGWGLNRIAVGPKHCSGASTSGVVHVDNLVEAHLLAGASLKTVAQESAVRQVEATDAGAETADVAGGERTSVRISSSRTVPACSGQAYFVADGRPCNPQAFLDGILDGLGFATSKVVRLPTRVALFAAWVAELACKAGVTTTPVLTRSDVRALADNRLFTNARAQRDLGYVPRADPATASRKLVESLERAGWAKHQVSRPGLAYWVCNPGGIWLTTLAAFGGPCPPFLAPLARKAEQVGLSLFHQASTVRAVCAAVYVIHVLEAVYAFRVARRAGHRDTAPGWMAQTFLLGFPSIFLVNELVPKKGEGLGEGGDGTK